MKTLQFLRGRIRLGERGSAELGAVAIAASLVAGVLFGNGIARTTVDVLDGVTWLKDEPSGEVVQINPATGRPQVRLGVGAPGDLLDVQQGDGRLVVLNRSTGRLSSFDLATLIASGQRNLGAGDSTKVLLGKQLFVANLSEGTISALDPMTTDSLGKMWTAGAAGLTDAVIDGHDRVWALREDGRLSRLTWSPADLAFSEDQVHDLAGIDEASVLVPHQQGVTLFGPAAGVVYQVGTGQDISANAMKLQGKVAAALTSPHDLVPASSSDTSTVILVSDGKVREIDVAAVGCRNPGAPAVFRSRVYVPCPDAEKVIVLGRDGRQAGADIDTRGGDPELVVDDGHLLINVPGHKYGVQVMSDGSTQTFVREDPSLPRQDGKPDKDPVKLVIDNVVKQLDVDNAQADDRPPPPPSYGYQPAGPKPGGGTTSGDPGPVAAPDLPTPLVRAKTVVDATTGTATMTITWEPPAGDSPTSYDVSARYRGERAGGTVAGDARTATYTFTCQEADRAKCPGGSATVKAKNAGSATVDAKVSLVGAPAPTTPTPTPPPPPEPTPTQPPPPEPTPTPTPEPMPANGATVVASVTGLRQPGTTMTVNLSPPADWASFPGSCVLHHTGNDSGADESQPIACSATSAQVVNDNVAGPAAHAVWVTASGAGGTVQSNTVSWSVRATTTPCQQPPVSIQRAGTYDAPEALPECPDIP